MPIVIDSTVVTQQGEGCAPIANPQSPMAAPNDVDATQQAAMAAPRVVSAKPYSDLPPFPLSHPRILYANLLTGASTTQPQVLRPSTFDRWSFTGSQSLEITLTNAVSMDTVALGACQINGRLITVDYSPDLVAGYVNFAAPRTNTESAMMFIRETPVSVRRLRVTVGGTGAGAIGVVSAGIALQMQRPIYGGVNPITLNRVTDYFSNQSESGNWLGRQIRRRGLESSLSFERLTAPWYRQYFDPFVRSARELPFFFAWRPSDYPAEVAYCWTDGDIQPSNSGGGNNYMSVSFSVKAHA